MEVLRCGGAVADTRILLGGALEEALETRARVLGPASLVAVWEQKGQPRGLSPLGETGEKELVDDDLRAVHEVSELGLPEHERVGGGDGVAVLEAERRVFRERRVVRLERGLRLGQVLNRRVALARPNVVQNEMPLRERPSLGVLAGQPHGDSLADEAGEGERLGVTPVDASPLECL